MRVGLRLKQRNILSDKMVSVEATQKTEERMFLMANSLAHTKWVCKYHIVFTPKYRRKIIYNQLRKDIQQIIRDLCKWKGVHDRAYDARSCTPFIEYPAENERVIIHGVSEREECDDDFRETRKPKVQVWKQKFLGNWILCKYSWD